MNTPFCWIFFFGIKKKLLLSLPVFPFFWDRMPGEELQFDANVNSVGTAHVRRKATFLC